MLGLMQALQYRLSSAEPVAEVIPYAAWYGGAFSDSDADLHSALIAFGEDAASSGPTGVVRDLEACASALERLLEGAAPECLIALASVKGNAAVRLDDFLRTRFVEITVHADDIASSVGVATPDFPAVAWELTIGVLAALRQPAKNRSDSSGRSPDRAGRPTSGADPGGVARGGDRTGP